MSDHHCPGLAECIDHPRWKISKGLIFWWVDPPMQASSHIYEEHFTTYAEAIQFAQKEATK